MYCCREHHLCVSGRCSSAGCDWVLGSGAREDGCGVCGGGGGSCQLRNGTSYPQTYLDGYQQVLSLPAGAKNVRLEEVAQSNDTAVLASNSFIAVAAQNGGSPSATPVLNWNYRVQWPGKQKNILSIREKSIVSFSSTGSYSVAGQQVEYFRDSLNASHHSAQGASFSGGLSLPVEVYLLRQRDR